HVCHLSLLFPLYFCFNVTDPPDIYPLSLPDALPISHSVPLAILVENGIVGLLLAAAAAATIPVRYLPPLQQRFSIVLLLALAVRSEEHTSELQSRGHLVCRLLLEKKKQEARTQDDGR